MVTLSTCEEKLLKLLDTNNSGSQQEIFNVFKREELYKLTESLKEKGLIEAEFLEFGEVLWAEINTKGKVYLENNKGFFKKIWKNNNIKTIWTVIGVIGSILTIVMFICWASS